MRALEALGMGGDYLHTERPLLWRPRPARMSNPYTVLGVERNASEKEISKASPPPAGGIGPRASGA